MGTVRLYHHEAFVRDALERLGKGEPADSIIASFTGLIPRPEAPVRVAELLLWGEAYGLEDVR